RVTPILDGANAAPGEGSRIPDGGTKLLAALAIAGEGALTLIGAFLNKLVFSGDLADDPCGAVDPYAGGVRLRRILPIARRPGEGHVSEQIADARVFLWERVKMPLLRHSLQRNRTAESGGKLTFADGLVNGDVAPEWSF